MATAATVGSTDLADLLPHHDRQRPEARRSSGRSTTTTSSHDVMNANSAPATTPGRISGRVMRRKVRTGPGAQALGRQLQVAVHRPEARRRRSRRRTARPAPCGRATRPTRDPAIFQRTNSENMPMAMMITGHDQRREDQRVDRAPAREPPARSPSAASVPSTVGEDRGQERHLDAVDEAGRSTAGLVSIFSYQRSREARRRERQGRSSDEKLIGTTTRVGADQEEDGQDAERHEEQAARLAPRSVTAQDSLEAAEDVAQAHEPRGDEQDGEGQAP